MEELNYFTGKFNKSELVNHFDSLNEEKLKSELENITNQYLKLSEEEQLKYASDFLYVCMMFVEEIDKSTAKKLLVTLNKVLLENAHAYSWFENFEYLHILYNYLFLTKEYEEYSLLFENDSYFFKIRDLILQENLEDGKELISTILSVFVRLFDQNTLPEERRNYFKKELESFISFIFKDNDFKDNDFKDNDFKDNDFKHIVYWYFELDKLVSIFQNDHLKMINAYFMENPQSEDVDDYLDFVSRHFDDVIEDSIEVIRKIAEENDSDIIRNQAIKLIEKYDNDYLNEKSDSEFILSFRR